MKVQELQNAVEAFDFDINSDEHIPDVGRLIADRQVVVVKQRVTEERHYDILDSWGSPGMSPVIGGIGMGKLIGKHWNPIRNTIARIGSTINPRHRSRMQSVTGFKKITEVDLLAYLQTVNLVGITISQALSLHKEL